MGESSKSLLCGKIPGDLGKIVERASCALSLRARRPRPLSQHPRPALPPPSSRCPRSATLSPLSRRPRPAHPPPSSRSPAPLPCLATQLTLSPFPPASIASDANVVLGTTGYTAVLNSCRSIRATDTGICQPGTLACQKTSATLTPFKCLARNITTSTFTGQARRARPSTHPSHVLMLGPRCAHARVHGTGSTLTITYDNGDFCPSQSANRRVLINYTCGTVRPPRPRRKSSQPRPSDRADGRPPHPHPMPPSYVLNL